MKVKVSELEKLIVKVLSATYYSESQAEEIAEVLLFAEKVGKNTQGMLKLMGTEPIQNIKPKYEPKIIKNTKLSSLIDGGGNPGILVAKLATKIVIDKCKKTGFGIVGTNNTFSSTGVIGYYAREIAKNDFIGIVMAGSPGAVSPYGGIEALFGTNPVAFGFPTSSDPLIFDMATSAITWYGLVRAKALGEKLPDNIAMDSEGNITTDSERAMNGSILTFDRSYKGSGLSMMIEMFTGPLVNGTYPGMEKNGWGNLFIAIDPGLLIDRKEFRKNSSLLINKVKNSKPNKNIGKVLIPGEKGLNLKRQIEKCGKIEIEDSLYKSLQALSS